MKAAVVCANEDVQYLDYEEPIPGPGEVKVKVRASGICGSDIPRVLHNGVHFYPIVLGHVHVKNKCGNINFGGNSLHTDKCNNGGCHYLGYRIGKRTDTAWNSDLKHFW